MEKLRFMLIGCGRISKNHIAAAAANFETCELVAVCDPVVELAEKKADDMQAAAGYRPAVYADYRQALGELAIDCCAIATESGYHERRVILGMQAHPGIIDIYRRSHDAHHDKNRPRHATSHRRTAGQTGHHPARKPLVGLVFKNTASAFVEKRP